MGFKMLHLGKIFLGELRKKSVGLILRWAYSLTDIFCYFQIPLFVSSWLSFWVTLTDIITFQELEL